MAKKYVSYFKYKNPVFSKKNVSVKELLDESAMLYTEAHSAGNKILSQEADNLYNIIISSENHTKAALQNFYAKIQKIKIILQVYKRSI
jgi:hypothetical protein